MEAWDEDDEGRERYVQPRWDRREPDEELYKCGACNRFFAGGVPLVLYLGEGAAMLNVEICDRCTGKVLAAHTVAQRVNRFSRTSRAGRSIVAESDEPRERTP
jgi:hypothetical protein